MLDRTGIIRIVCRTLIAIMAGRSLASRLYPGREREYNVVEIKLKRGESVDKALRRLKKKLDKEGIMRDIRNHRYFEKPCEKRRKKASRSRAGLKM